MKLLPSKLFSDCQIDQNSDARFYDIIPDGFDEPVSLYLGTDTTADDAAIEKSAIFFDDIHKWNKLCREKFIAEFDDDDVNSYFDFYLEEA